MDYVDLNRRIGNRIRKYRKLRNYSLEEFSQLLNKSKSSISKYENGETGIVIELLYEIAEKLNISVYQLIDIQETLSSPTEPPEKNHYCQTASVLYLYVVNSRGTLWKNVMELSENGQVFYFSNVASLDDYKVSQYFYTGYIEKQDSANRVLVMNHINQRDMLILNYYDSLANDGGMLGFITSFSLGHYTPSSTKCMISPVPLKEDAKLREALKISAFEIKELKKTNYFKIQYSV